MTSASGSLRCSRSAPKWSLPSLRQDVSLGAGRTGSGRSARLKGITMEHRNGVQGNTKQIRLVKRSPMCWRVTFDRPPLNIFGPETIPQLNEIVTALETDK